MTSEEKRGSLADQAAAWVPPWARNTTAPDPDPAGVTSPEPDPTSRADADGRDGRDERGPGEEQASAEADAPEPVDGTVPGDRDLTVDGTARVTPALVGDESVPAEPAPGGATGATARAGTRAGARVGAPATPAVTAARDERLALLDEAELLAALEAILLVVDEPVAEQVLAQVLEQPVDRIGTALRTLARDYTEAGRGFDLRRAAGGWRLYTRPEYASYVERFVLDGQSVRLTQAALETLAVVAYKQPVTRSRISAIRGVNCDGVIRTLLTRGLVQECGTESESGAHLYQTTPLFLEKLGIDSVDELPPLAPFLPDNVEEIADASR